MYYSLTGLCARETKWALPSIRMVENPFLILVGSLHAFLVELRIFPPLGRPL